jgi:large subunit ribosomal protein L11
LGPALGPLGINILQVVNTINEKTKDFPGMKVPVKVEVDSETKKFTVEVGIPPTAALIFKESGINKGSGTAGTNFVGNVSMESIVKIAKMKMDVSYAQEIKSTAKEIIGSCLSLGIKVEDKVAKDVYADISAGKYDSLFE